MYIHTYMKGRLQTKNNSGYQGNSCFLFLTLYSFYFF
jgi:hypothetical protein